jgi:hypothetical protein
MNAARRERIQDAGFRRAVELLDAGDTGALRAHLLRHADLVRQRVAFEEDGYFSNPALLDFIAENPIRRGALPANIVDVARVILDAGARDEKAGIDSALALVSSGRIPRESGVQVSLIDLLCDYGGDPNGSMPAALVHGEFDAAAALMRRGAEMTLAVAAATGRTEDARRLLPTADELDRHAALALSAQWGHVEIVELLLDAGEDANRYNPKDFHAHSTPLHQAALAGHEDVVRLLVERGARLDIVDRRFHGTALDWANYAAQTEVAEYLRAHGANTADEPAD